MFRVTPQNSFRLMVIGEGGVGKSALVVKYLTGRFIWEYQSDFDWKYSYETNIDGNQVHMEIIDSLTMDESHVQWAEGFMFVYDITNEKSVERVKELRQKIDFVRSASPFVMVVVGNKADLEHFREVEKEKAERITTQLSAACHVDCSASGSEVSVRYAFDELCREVAHFRHQASHKRERRRSSLSTMKQNLKNLVQTGKSKNNSSGLDSGSSSPVIGANGRVGPAFKKGNRFCGTSSSYSSLISASGLKDLPEESDHFASIYSDDSDKKSHKSRESSSDGREDSNKRPSVHQHRNVVGAIVL